MARYIVDLTEYSSSSFAAGDYIEMWHAGGGSNRSKKVALNRFAMLTGAVFTGVVQAASVNIVIGDNGTGTGGVVTAGSNTNGSTPAPGSLRCNRAVGGGSTWIFPDDTNIWRLTTTAPTNANYTGANVVGAQTSSLAAKELLEGETPITEVLEAIAQGAAAVRRFVYKPGFGEPGEEGAPRPFGGEQFEGVVIDFAPRYGYDLDALHPYGKSLNEITVIGDLLRAVDWLVREVGIGGVSPDDVGSSDLVDSPSPNGATIEELGDAHATVILEDADFLKKK